MKGRKIREKMEEKNIVHGRENTRKGPHSVKALFPQKRGERGSHGEGSRLNGGRQRKGEKIRGEFFVLQDGKKYLFSESRAYRPGGRKFQGISRSAEKGSYRQPSCEVAVWRLLKKKGDRKSGNGSRKGIRWIHAKRWLRGKLFLFPFGGHVITKRKEEKVLVKKRKGQSNISERGRGNERGFAVFCKSRKG